ncbi:nuclear nucleic acid-binding protein C1D [Drosophila novamexicana]|uniref:nuclear nucleic acid-binding protein C1D n=1 Tax=Drosophila novamexicana TaxID=47314 RepID=UPI0011E5CC3B|nr:nuclear nucleic acid-binding protein C1D [Drosophila novamexicana]
MAGIITPSCGNQPTIDCNGQLHDDQLLGILVNFSASLDVLEKDLHSAIRAHNFRSLSTEEQVKVDTFLVYVNSTLFWMYLKLQGYDLSKHYILHDLGRAREMLAREKQTNSSKTAPRLDIAASKRFIAAGMHTRFVDMEGVMVTEAQYMRSLTEASGSNIQ